MKITVKESKKNEDLLDAIIGSEVYSEKIDELQDIYHKFEEKLGELGMELVLDGRGDYMLTAVPKSIVDKIDTLSDADVTRLLDNSYALSTPKHLITIIK